MIFSAQIGKERDFFFFSSRAEIENEIDKIREAVIREWPPDDIVLCNFSSVHIYQRGLNTSPRLSQ